MHIATKAELALKMGYSPDEAAELIGISRTLLYAEWAAGREPARLKIGRRRIVTGEAIKAYLAELQAAQQIAA